MASASTSYLRILREQWIVVLLAMILCVAGGLIGRNVVPTSYSSESDLLISPIDISDETYVGVSVFRSVSSDPTSNVLTLARYLKTPATAAIVKRDLKLRDSPEDVLKSISVKPLSQTNIVSVDASAKSPRLAAQLADAFANATITRRSAQVQADLQAVIARLQTQIGRSKGSAATTATLQARLASLRSLVGLPDPTVSVLNRAQVPTAPDKPATSLVVIATGLAGLLLGFGVALFNDTVGGKLRREDELLVRNRLPVLARVPRLSDATLREYLAGRSNLPPGAWEAYRTLRTNVLHSPRPGGKTPVILLTSAMAGEGKTLTAVNLAVTLAAQDMQVLLVDGDFRRPMIASIFRMVPPKDGFGAAFIRGNPSAAISPVPGYENLRVLVPTLAHLGQIDLLDSERVEHLFGTLRGMADVIVVDSAPATEVSDPLLLAAAADMTIIAVRLGYTRRNRLDALRESLGQYGVQPAGLVVTVRSPPEFAPYGSTMPVPIELKAPRRGDGTAAASAAIRSKRSK